MSQYLQVNIVLFTINSDVLAVKRGTTLASTVEQPINAVYSEWLLSVRLCHEDTFSNGTNHRAIRKCIFVA